MKFRTDFVTNSSSTNYIVMWDTSFLDTKPDDWIEEFETITEEKIDRSDFEILWSSFQKKLNQIMLTSDNSDVEVYERYRKLYFPDPEEHDYFDYLDDDDDDDDDDPGYEDRINQKIEDVKMKLRKGNKRLSMFSLSYQGDASHFAYESELFEAVVNAGIFSKYLEIIDWLES